ncbi:IclR family transcriptional regulator [Halostella pelagica]|uniref:IclR family transcriptional regulator n=1 Tax=Halostella pelagica TaxID=2583824 RepID=UPI0013874F91|nr:IclR family transcriptional regulator [Halostella pelagica]
MADEGTREIGRVLETTERSITVLQAVKEMDGATISDLVQELEIAKSTVHAHLSTLQKHGLLAKENNRYHLGLRLFHLGQHVRGDNVKFELAGETVEDLAEMVNENADFTVVENGRLLTIHNSTNPNDPFKSGGYFHMHSTAAGKAILAALPREDVELVIERHGTPEFTEHTITEMEELYATLEEVRKRGYAYNDQEAADSLRGVGTVVNNPDGSIFGALSVGGPAYRIQGDLLHEKIPTALRDKAAELEEKIEEYERTNI